MVIYSKSMRWIVQEECTLDRKARGEQVYSQLPTRRVCGYRRPLFVSRSPPRPPACGPKYLSRSPEIIKFYCSGGGIKYLWYGEILVKLVKTADHQSPYSTLKRQPLCETSILNKINFTDFYLASCGAKNLGHIWECLSLDCILITSCILSLPAWNFFVWFESIFTYRQDVTDHAIWHYRDIENCV